MSDWHHADILEAIAQHQPEAPAQAFVDPLGGEPARRYSQAEMHRRANGVAATLIARGAKRQDKVAQYLYNVPEYLESVLACFKASLVPVNTNYRYVEGELLYLWDNADVVAVVFHGCFASRIADLRSKMPGIHTWLWVDDGSGPCPEWAIPYEQAAAATAGDSLAFEAPWPRSGDDLWLLYTGGTTGMPKGVMWRLDDLWLLGNDNRPEPFDLSGGVEGLAPQFDELLMRRVSLPACPLMHGTGFLTALGGMLNGGTVITLANRRFDAVATLEAITREKINGMAIVGDAFARPMVRALEAEPDRFDLSSLEAVVSSGAMWSAEVKRELLRFCPPETILTDSLGSSESIGMGRSDSTAGEATETASFVLGDNACVIDDDGNKVEPGSGVLGRIAVTGHIPVGYYKDPEKTAAIFTEVDGVRYSMAGDYATVEADGSLKLYGRGSVCINSGGEKIFPEEVEEVLKTHPSVRDAVCVGVPDERFGQAVTAVVELDSPGRFSEADVIGWVKRELASYKAPKRVLVRDTVGRAANGKADYNGLREWAVGQLAAPEATG
ncbi:MAG: AMP-binding protein [Acidobacteriota bacterium]|nr:AMP-binding protein [Acidobacteriota bacterium]